MLLPVCATRAGVNPWKAYTCRQRSVTAPTKHPLPDQLSDDEGALLEPLGVALHALDLAHVRVGMCVAVVGCGPIGLMLVQLARVARATRVLAREPLAHRLDAAVGFGAEASTTRRARRRPRAWPTWSWRWPAPTGRSTRHCGWRGPEPGSRDGLKVVVRPRETPRSAS